MHGWLEALSDALTPARLWSSLPMGLALGAASFLLALLLANHWSRVRYFVRISFYYVMVSAVSLFCCLPSLATPKNPGNLLHVWRVFRGRSSWLFGVDFQVLHAERLQSLGSCILVANHQNSLDIIGIVCNWRLFHPCVPVMKRWFLFSGPVGLICWLSGSVFVDRSNSARDRQALNAKLRDISEGRLSLFVFPEGTRNAEPQLLPFKKGAFYMALQCQVPIVPIVFSRYSGFFDVNKKIYNNGRVTMTVLPPVSTRGMDTDNVSELTSRVQALMQAHIDWELSNDGQMADTEDDGLGCGETRNSPPPPCPVGRCSPDKSRTLI
ncbi:1-acyl-sn-glycerol-3-phosphate acyltransferase beta-like [Amblyomma americanum]